MKIIISSTGTTLQDDLDTRFGRTKYFISVDSDTNEVDSFDNVQNLTAVQGAGIQSAMNVAEHEPDAVITGHCGPKAFRVLNEANIKVYLCKATTIVEALELFKKGELSEAKKADVEGHWA